MHVCIKFNQRIFISHEEEEFQKKDVLYQTFQEKKRKKKKKNANDTIILYKMIHLNSNFS